MIMYMPENTEDLQKCEFDWMPESICKEMGQFNVFILEPYPKDRVKHVPYMRPGFYKIILMIGNSKIQGSDTTKEVRNQSLVFYNPRVPCKSVYTGSILRGYYCIFSSDFFQQYENFNQYEVFQPDGIHVFDLSEEQANKLTGYYECMFKEIDSNYIYKFDVLRNLVFKVLHFAMKNLTI
jgi:AraC family transcriptional regulator, transcriptional activator of pobA